MKDILEKLALLESEKPKAALLDKKFSSFRDMEQLQGDAKITTAHKPVKMGDKQKGLTGKLVGTSEAVETTVEDLVAQLGSEFKSQFIGDKKAKKDKELTNKPKDKELGEKKPANDIHVKEGIVEGLEDSPVASAITRRIMLQRIDLLSKYGPEKVMAAIDEVADFVGDVEEIGSSDVSGWIKHVEQMLGNMGDEDIAEGSQRVDSLVTDALKIMQGSEVDDAVKALKTVLGDREYNGRRGHYNFYVRQIVDMSSQQGVGEGFLNNTDRNRERNAGLEHEKNNIQVTINGKPWKVFAGRGTADSTEEYRHLQSMKAWAQKKSDATGKKWDVYLTGSPADVSEDAVADFLARGGQIQVGKPSRGPRRPGTSFGSKHIGTGRGGKASNQSGKSANTGPTAKPVVAVEGIEMDQDSASPVGSMPADTIPQVHHVTEDWGSSDWHPVMKGMWDVIDRHYAGRANPESIEDAAQNAAEFYYDDMGYDEVEDAKDSIIGMFLRRPDGIGRKRDKSPEQELEEAGVVPAAPVAGAPADAGMQGQLNIKQLASVLPGLDARTLAMAMTTMKAGREPSMAQQKALAGAFAALVKADPQTTTKAMAILKKVSSDPVAAPVAAKPAPTAPAPAAAPAPVPAEESMDYIKENKRKK